MDFQVRPAGQLQEKNGFLSALVVFNLLPPKNYELKNVEIKHYYRIVILIEQVLGTKPILHRTPTHAK